MHSSNPRQEMYYEINFNKKTFLELQNALI